MMIPLAFKSESERAVASILTNISAMTALQTLRAVSSSLGETQGRVSSGLRVGTASDNAAYWSISTTMRSDHMAMAAVSDALGLGAAKVDTASAGLEAVIDILAVFKARLIAATEAGVDRSKIQEELEQLKQQVVSVAEAASFSGQNWLNTDIADIYDNDINIASVTSGFVRGPAGDVSVKKTTIHLSEVALFNSTGGGLLQADARDVTVLGGMRQFISDEDFIFGDSTVYFGEAGSGWMVPERASGTAARIQLANFPVGSPIDFNIPGAAISFDLLLDKEASNPNNWPGGVGQLEELPGPFDPGAFSAIQITKADVDNYNLGLNGIVSTNADLAGVLNKKFQASGIGAYVYRGSMYDPVSETTVPSPTTLYIETREDHGSGSHVAISNISSVGVSDGGLVPGESYGTRRSGMQLSFEQFIVHEDGDNDDGVEISFTFSLNGAPATSHSFNRTYVNQVLGKDNGKVGTPEEMATLLHSLLDADWPNLIIEATSPSTVMIKSDPAFDREWGSDTSMDFDNIRVSIEPLPIINFLDIDVAENPEMVDGYIDYLEVTTARVISGAALVGALQTRIAMQTAFTDKLMANVEKGIGRLVDADMNEESARLKALQTQEQLAIQTLSIANTSGDSIMQLFR